MRGREFLMKDAYSFDVSVDDARTAYRKMFVAYLRTFERLGLKALPMAADTGPIGGDMSHEFVILAETGESAVYCHRDLIELPAPGDEVSYHDDLTLVIEPYISGYAATDEKHDQAAFEADVPADKRVEARGIEVGHIFYFATKVFFGDRDAPCRTKFVSVLIATFLWFLNLNFFVSHLNKNCNQQE